MPFRCKRVRLTTLLAALALLAAACSGGSEATSEGVATLEDETAAPLGDAAAAETLEDAEPEISAEEAGLLFTQCLRDEGMDVADVGVDADGRLLLREAFENVDRQNAEFTEALETCRLLIEDAGFGQGGRAAIGENVEVQDALVEFSQCIRDAGYDVGDVTLGGGQPGQGQGQAQPADGDAEEGEAPRGQGQRQGGFGNRNARFATQLGLDIEDPEVEATIEACAPILDAAFTAAGVGQGAGRPAGG